MAKAQRTTDAILQGVVDTLATAQLGLRDLASSDPTRRLPGLRNLVVFGRAVTNALQNLRSTERDFDAWYQPYVEEMRSDPLMTYFYDLRSEILKEGSLPISVSVQIHSFNFLGDLHRFDPPPPHAKGFFMGDQTGGSGWEVELPDGETAKYYVQVPADIGTFSIHLSSAPTQHLGNHLQDNRIETLGTAYFEYLERIVRAGRSKWAKSGA